MFMYTSTISLKTQKFFYSVILRATYRDGKIVHTQEEYEDLDYEPSEGQSWTWEDVGWWEMITATEVTFEERQAFANQKGIPTLTNSSADNEWRLNLS